MTGTPGVMGMGMGMGIVLEGLLQHRRGRAGGQQAGQGGEGQSGAGIRHVRQGYLVEQARTRAPRRHSQMPISPGMVGMYLTK